MSRNLIVYGFSASISAGFYAGQLQFMRREGYDVAVISSPGPETELLAANEGVSFFPVEIAREISFFGDLRALLRLYRLLRKLRPALTNFGTPKAGLLGSLAAFAARVPCRIYTLHGLRLETASGISRSILWCAEWVACRTSHVTVCVSESLRKKALELKLVRPESVRVLGSGTCNGVDTARFGETNAAGLLALQTELGIPPSAPVVGFVGRLVRDKGISELVMAFQKLSETRPDLRLLLVGDFEAGDPVSPEVRAYIHDEPRIILTGHVADTAPYYQLMQVFALPSHREGFGAASLEAQASSIPVVVSTATGVIDSIVAGVTGTLVPVANAGALAIELDRLLADADLRKRMGEAGRERAVRDFSPESIWKGLASLYRDLLGKVRTVSERRPLEFAEDEVNK